MVDNNLAKRILKLRSEIDQHAKAYYELDNPSVSDAVYDGLVRELKDLDKKYPEFADPNFIIYRVGGKALDHFEKKQHSIRMLSLNDAFSTKEIHGWNDRIQKLLTSNAFRYFCELKLDGLAVSLIYVDGTLKEAITRGDGQIGENITQNVKTISSIPLAIKSKLKGTFEVRGEIVMSKKTLTRLNKKYAKLGRPQLANTRNAAAGSVRQLDATITAERSLDFFAWDIAESERKFETHSQKHSFLREIGFATAPYEAVCKTLIEVEKVIADIEKVRDGFDFGTDGVVIQIDEVSLHKTLGVVGKAPRYALAYKYPAEQATTMVTNITTHVGRTGILTPLAHFKPTLVAGSTVSKATLHNIDQIRRLDIRVGDTVVIQKAGDVIPEIVEVLKNLRPGKTNQFQMPKVCPECSRSVEQRSGVTGDVSVGFYCTNSECPAKQTRTIEHFVKTMEIYEVGPKIVERLQEEGLISDAADLFSLTESDLAGLERFGAKSAENIIREINKVYELQSASISRKHIEIIIRQMFSRRKIKESCFAGTVLKRILFL